MPTFHFENMVNSTSEEVAAQSDCYFEANLIDSPKDYFANLPKSEQDEILAFYRGGKFLRIIETKTLVGFIGHGVRPTSDTIMISYILLPIFRGKGLFRPMINAFAVWCVERYPEKKYFRANTEKSNEASIISLRRAGFEFLEEKMDGPDDANKVLFHCFVKKISD